MLYASSGWLLASCHRYLCTTINLWQHLPESLYIDECYNPRPHGLPWLNFVTSSCLHLHRQGQLFVLRWSNYPPSALVQLDRGSISPLFRLKTPNISLSFWHLTQATLPLHWYNQTEAQFPPLFLLKTLNIRLSFWHLSQATLPLHLHWYNQKKAQFLLYFCYRH